MLKGLSSLIEAGEDLTPAMDEIGAMMISSIAHRFETGTGPDGKAWTPSKRVLAEGGQTLVKDGHYRDSFSHKAENNAVEVGSNHIGAAIHHFGGVIKPVNAKKLAFKIGGKQIFAAAVTIPERPVLGFSETDEKEILFILEDHIRRSVGGSA